MSMPADMVEFPSNGSTAQGYLATPEGGSGPGVLVIQEYWGLVPHIQRVCDRFAGAGFVALAPDLFHGIKTTEPNEATKLIMALTIDQAAKDMRGAAAYLAGLPQVTSQRVGVVGFCVGGALALYAASVSPEIGPVVDFYGFHPQVRPDFSKISGPVMGNFAARDDSATPKVVQQLQADLTARGIQHDFKTYPGTDHAFFNEDRSGPGGPYNAAAAEDAWQRTVRFFGQHVR
jgi:carboxymethylenebutenolidase